ncbi:Hypothetical protein R9X50_00179800 [Acrodontium crateriforme]|uniref:Uncharacterized protein n=1 Tax=Acrodontium crateriforme TaxID=150365 RepID=A0AAQ3M5T7_9PEZI|nr:Hypothetical protein R9X50_00179800 [Acrodontium crateriforme]
MAAPLLSLPLRQLAKQTQSTARPRNLHTLHSGFNKPSRLHSRIRNAPPTRRHAGTFAGNARKLFRENPFNVTLAVFAIIAGTSSIIYANYMYQTYIIGAFHKFPEPVAKKLRRALYYTNQDFQPKDAIKYYKQALQVAEDEGMDPFSDEIMGVKIQVAALMEKCNQPAKAIQVLQILKKDSLEWIKQFGAKENNKEKRTRILAKCVGISVKLGDLYVTPEVWDREAAEEQLVWAVETSLKELSRRQANDVKDEDEGEWLSPSEMGAQLEALAHRYEEKNQHYLSTPLFLQALSLYPTKDCHTVILMNNLASSLAQQSPRAAAAAQAYATSRTIKDQATKSTAPSQSLINRETMIQNASIWAQKALDVAAGIKPPERNEECNFGCAVAMHNLGEFAEMMGDRDLARSKYAEAISLSRAISFQEGVDNSSKRLRLLDGKD